MLDYRALLQHFDSESKAQSVSWKHYSVFWNCKGIVLTDYLEHGCTIIQEPTTLI